MAEKKKYLGAGEGGPYAWAPSKFIGTSGYEEACDRIQGDAVSYPQGDHSRKRSFCPPQVPSLWAP